MGPGPQARVWVLVRIAEYFLGNAFRWRDIYMGSPPRGVPPSAGRVGAPPGLTKKPAVLLPAPMAKSAQLTPPPLLWALHGVFVWTAVVPCFALEALPTLHAGAMNTWRRVWLPPPPHRCVCLTCLAAPPPGPNGNPVSPLGDGMVGPIPFFTGKSNVSVNTFARRL